MKSISLHIVLAFVASSIGSGAVAATVNLPDVTITSLGHSYFFFPDDSEAFANDGVTIPSGFGTYSTSPFLGQVNNGDTVVQKIVAPAGQKFSVDRNPGFAYQTFHAKLNWLAGGDITSNFPALSTTFENLVGTAPTATYTLAGLGESGNAITLQFQGDVTDDFSFTGITFSFTVGHTPSVSGDRTFNIGSSSSPSIASGGFTNTDFDAVTMTLTPVPEPSSFALAATSLAGLAAFRRKRRTQI